MVPHPWATRLLLTFLCCCPDLGLAQERTPDEDEAQVIDETVVTASPIDRQSDQLAVPVTTLGREGLLREVGSTLADSIMQLPGMTATTFSAGASRPLIRGQDAQRVRVLENGVGTHDASGLSQDHGVPVNPLAAQRVEILRGPSTLRYGGGAIGGVVNALTNRVPRSVPEEPAEGEIYSAYGFGSRQRDAAVLLEGRESSVAYHLDGMFRDSRDYDIPRSPDSQPGTDTDGYALSGGASWFSERSRLGLAFARFANDYGVPEDPGESVEIHLWKNSWMFEGDYAPALPGIEELRFRGGLSDYEHDELVGGSGTVSTFDNDEFEGRVELLHAPFLGFTGAGGLHLVDRDLEAGGESQEFLAPSETRTYAFYLFEDRPLGDRLDLQLGARAESTEVRGTPFVGARRSERFTPLSASAGLIFTVSDAVRTAFTLSAMQRAPDTVELYARGPHEASRTFEIGDPSFDEETSSSADLVLNADWGRVRGELAAYYTHYDDFIYGFLTGVPCDQNGCPAPAGDLDQLLYVQDEATFYGGEFEGSIDLFDLWVGTVSFDARLDFVRARLDHGNVPRVPPWRWGAGLAFASEKLTSRFGFLHTSAQNRLGSGDTRTAAFAMFRASLGYRLYDGDRPLDFFVTASNLFDADARNHVALNKDRVLQPGRNIRLGLHGRFW